MRKVGDIISDLENLCEELIVQHDLQRGDVLGIVYNYLTVHYPVSIEEYLDGSNPIYYYGPKETLENYREYKKLKNDN